MTHQVFGYFLISTLSIFALQAFGIELSPSEKAEVVARERAEFKSVMKPIVHHIQELVACLLYTSPSPRDRQKSRMPSSA